MKRSFVDFCRAGFFAGTLMCGVKGAQGADVWNYTAERGSFYSQTSAGAPTPVAGTPYAFRAVVEGDVFDAIFDASIRTPLGGDLVLQLDDNTGALVTEIQMPTLSALNTIAPSGAYTFLFDTDNDGVTVVQMNLDSTAFPTAIPQVSNFAAAQQIDASADFTLTFNNFGNQTGTERWELEVLEDGFQVLSDSGTGGSVTIPGEALFANSTYDARLRFVREADRDTTSYPGAIGTFEVYNETQFTISTGGGGGGGDDTTAPILLFVNPASETQDVPVQTPLTFAFSESMAATQSIEWSANVNPAQVNYTWLNNGQVLVATYIPGFPANSTITWKLNPSVGNANFKDVAGNLLAVNQYQGTFTTAGGGTGTNDPCNGGGGDDGRGAGTIYKSLNFVQTGNNAPVPDSEMAASFSSFFNAGTNQVISAVSVTGPGGTENLMNLFGNFLLSEEFSGGAALETAYPAGNYTMSLTGTGGGSATINVGSTAQLPIPQISNLVALQSMNVSNAFTLNFAQFTGAGANDGIFIEITGDEGQGEFYAPDLCVPRELPNTATSVVIPASTFKAGQTYRGSISFSRAGQDSSSIPNTIVVAGVSVRTSFEFTIGGVTVRQPMWSDVVRNPNGTLTYTIQGDTGLTVRIEGSNSPVNGWAEVGTAVLATGSHQFTVDPKLAPMRFLRAIVL